MHIEKYSEKHKSMINSFFNIVKLARTNDIAKMLDISEENARKTGQRAKAKLEVLCREQGLIC